MINYLIFQYEPHSRNLLRFHTISQLLFKSISNTFWCVEFRMDC